MACVSAYCFFSKIYFEKVVDKQKKIVYNGYRVKEREVIKMLCVYVVYGVEEDDLKDLMIFDDYRKAKEYVENQRKKGIELKIWQRPIK